MHRDGAGAIVSVRDNGIGMAPDQLTSVFDMLTQVDRSNRRAQGGLGIGLTLVKSLVAMHGGGGEARSGGLNCGSEFVVTLPVMREQTVAPADPVPLKEFPHRRILVVDDNQDAAETLGELLTTLGATAAVVHSGRAALDALAVFEPDSVLLDIGMPGMDGYEVAQHIRASAKFHDLLLIALTGGGQEHDRRRSSDAGFDHHVVKPPDLDELREFLMVRRPSTGSRRPRGRPSSASNDSRA